MHADGGSPHVTHAEHRSAQEADCRLTSHHHTHETTSNHHRMHRHHIPTPQVPAGGQGRRGFEGAQIGLLSHVSHPTYGPPIHSHLHGSPTYHSGPTPSLHPCHLRGVDH